ncbi:hypothetical protein [Clostridium sp. MD294]|uniref:hypothetical protein n=1 Tax=Clostridium sp. MD294 TaxID=97138 RepID=UPI0002CC8094|nr:hypothetical protein [Clostridium sp. MD294]NDO46846.1 hypothetical protein [Clostridium sp. MD294]USF28711.1 hypothetical protein C820_000085 [Clostridium sp. MD294]
MKKLKKQIAILLIFCLVLLCVGCNNTNQTNNNENQSEENENNQYELDRSYDEYFAQIVSENAEDLDWTILLMDLKSGEVLGSYGDVNDNFEPGNILKPIVYASLIENGVLLEESVDVSAAEYNGEYYRSKENFTQGEIKTVLESMELLNNPAIINIWKDFDKKQQVLYDLSSIGVMLSDNVMPLIGYDTIINSTDIAQVYRELANKEEQSDEPFIISAQTKQIVNDIMKKTFDNVCELNTELYTTYGVFGTVIHKENEYDINNINTNFAGYLKEKKQQNEGDMLKENGEGVVLVVNVTSSEEAYTIEKLTEIVNNIFADYALNN